MNMNIVFPQLYMANYLTHLNLPELGCISQPRNSHLCCRPDSSQDVIAMGWMCKPGCYSGWRDCSASRFQSARCLRILWGRNLQKGWQLGWKNILEVEVEHFKKCFVNHHPDTQKCIMYRRLNGAPTTNLILRIRRVKSWMREVLRMP